MQRRDALKRTALMLGYALSASSIAAIMNGCTVDNKVAEMGLDAWTPGYLSKENGKVIAHLAECIIPETDTPGAINAGVHSFIDTAVSDRFTTAEKETFNKDLENFKNRFQEVIGKAFLDAKDAERTEFLIQFEKEAFDQSKTEGAPKHFWFTMKELTLLGFCTSEAGSKQALKFDPIPGEYNSCIPLSEVGRAWAL